MQEKLVRILHIEKNNKRFFVHCIDKEGLYNVFCSTNFTLFYSEDYTQYIGHFVVISFEGNLIYSFNSSSDCFRLSSDKGLIGKVFKFLVDSIPLIKNEKLQDLVKLVLCNDKFKVIPSSIQHHNWMDRMPGGNLIHTATLISLCKKLMNDPLYQNINFDVLLTAIYWHDYGKIFLYDITDDYFFEYANLKNSILKNVGHVLFSATEFYSAAIINNLGSDLLLRIWVCILGSHGRKDWDTIIEPELPEAHLLHFLDMTAGKLVTPESLINLFSKGG